MTDAERIANLEDEVAYLRSELGLAQDATKIKALKVSLGLTETEALLLHALYATRQHYLSRAQVFDATRPSSRRDCTLKIVDVYVSKLRRKIGSDIIKTLWGYGYCLTPQGVALVQASL